MPDTARGIKRKRRSPSAPDPDAFINQARGAESGMLDEALDALSPVEKEAPERLKTFNLRLPASLHEKLEAVSKATGKSMHEVCMTLLVPGIEKAYDRYVE